MKYLTWLWRNSRGERLNMCVRVMVGVLQVAAGLATVWLSKKFIDETITNGSDQDMYLMIALLMGTVIAGVFMRQLNFYLNVKCTTRGANRLRVNVFSKIFQRKLFSSETLHSGDVASRVMKDVETICDVNFDKIPQMLVTTLQLIGGFLMMRWFDPRLAWALLLTTPVVLALGKLIAKRLRKMTAEIRECESRIQMHVQECAEHDDLIRSMESEGFVSRLLKDKQANLMGRVIKRSRFTVAIRITMGLAFGLGYMLAFVWGGIGLRHGTITFGIMTSFLQLVSQIQHPIFNLLNAAPQVIHATASIDRIEEITHTEDVDSTTAESNSATEKHRIVADNRSPASGNEQCEPAGVRFENVSFAYSDDRKILDHVNLDFKPGSKIALMGETGAGKTTLFRMMLGLVTPLSGHVTIYSAGTSGESAAELRFPAGIATRKYFVFVPQGNSLISGSLRLNLQMAKPTATDSEIETALHTACADFVKDLPAGLDTEIGERGYGLSEGQAQRIAVARGLLQDGTIMLLDEISAALDTDTEQEMYSRIFKAYPHRTMIFITHRDAVCKMCDETVKL